MSQALRSHLRHNVVAYLALFVALGGSSYAAIKLPAGSVGNKQLRNSAVTKLKVKKGAISTDRLAAHAVTASRLAKGSVTSTTLAANAVRGSNIANGSLTASDLAAGQIPPPAPATIAARARNTAAVNTGDGDYVSVPLSGNTWTQAPNEFEQVFSEVTVDAPATCGKPSQFVFTGVTVDELIDGVSIGTSGPVGVLGAGQRIPISAVARFEPAAATPHTLTLRIKDNCTGAGESYTLQSAKIDVTSLR